MKLVDELIDSMDLMKAVMYVILLHFASVLVLKRKRDSFRIDFFGAIFASVKKSEVH